jgi:diguanylate cyclase (GGDEF)-like protein/PAS domain S-box-containing protein
MRKRWTSLRPRRATAAGAARDLRGRAFEHAAIGAAVLGGDGRLLAANRALGAFVGRDAAALVGGTLADFTHPDHRDGDLVVLREVLSGTRASGAIDSRYVHPDGGVVWGQLTVAPMAGPGPARAVVQLVDVTERKERELVLQHLADHDPLTGLLNRRSFEQALERELLLGRRQDTPAALLLLDLDGFKAVNDTLGHAAGDEVLRQVAARLRRRLRRSDLIGRLGGDEFAMLLPNTPAGDAEAVADAIRADIGGIVVGDLHGCRASVGIASLDRGAGTDDVLAAADRAMYAAKRAR